MARDEELHDRIEAIEAGYEFMLAFAAQGYEAGQGGAHSDEAKSHLTKMADALSGLAAVATDVATSIDGDGVASYQAFLDALEQDALKAQGAIRLVLGRGGISSQLVDNLNASLHLRALLTDLFLIDEAFKGKG